MLSIETGIYSSNDPQALEQAGQLLRGGGLVAFPTDTVYGLGADAFDARAIERLYIAKGREAVKAIAVLVGRPDALAQVAAEMGEMAPLLAERFWPGPLTLVLKSKVKYGMWVTHGASTLGVRVSPHTVAQKLPIPHHPCLRRLDGRRSDQCGRRHRR